MENNLEIKFIPLETILSSQHIVWVFLFPYFFIIKDIGSHFLYIGGSVLVLINVFLRFFYLPTMPNYKRIIFQGQIIIVEFRDSISQTIYVSHLQSIQEKWNCIKIEYFDPDFKLKKLRIPYRLLKKEKAELLKERLSDYLDDNR